MREVDGDAASTVRRRLSALSSLFKHLVRYDDAEKNPVAEVGRPAINRRHGTTLAFSKQDAAKLLNARRFPHHLHQQRKRIFSGSDLMARIVPLTEFHISLEPGRQLPGSWNWVPLMHSHHLWKLIAWSLVAILAICLCVVSALFFEASFRVLRRRTEGKTDPSSVRTRATFEKMKKKGYSGITLGLMFCASGFAYLAILVVFIKAIISSQQSQILGFLLTYSLPLIFSMVLLALFLITMKSLGRTRIEKIRDMWDKREEETWSQGDETGPFVSFLLWILSKLSCSHAISDHHSSRAVLPRFPRIAQNHPQSRYLMALHTDVLCLPAGDWWQRDISALPCNIDLRVSTL